MQFIFFRQVISEPQNNQIYANIDFFALNLLMWLQVGFKNGFNTNNEEPFGLLFVKEPR